MLDSTQKISAPMSWTHTSQKLTSISPYFLQVLQTRKKPKKSSNGSSNEPVAHLICILVFSLHRCIVRETPIPQISKSLPWSQNNFGTSLYKRNSKIRLSLSKWPSSSSIN